MKKNYITFYFIDKKRTIGNTKISKNTIVPQIGPRLNIKINKFLIISIIAIII